ncbi:Dihydroorotate dehydrogenase B (NAD(+)), electron transfer subunit [Posidoniimonas polymericola]|uniref:Dihydroorotate dehydrogenase B (NAD(+)), electron transfer subunit n=1 Tax=Posidoniimonas polymericola TaxID=2528002 RepID=A0A5C5YMN2_9BACT|nr:dihydroorotate dehydrogenase electron transfer subunit [Posidoniimonas polymericola]TWT76067.1 Dihydroorotate dehydrogenase B (NAD(+)), electron transfer subunit [Posidoniimonas polymericola]
MDDAPDCHVANGHDSLHAAHYADHAAFTPAVVLENEQLARGTYRMRIDAAGIAERIVPGQFVMVRVAGQVDPMLGRAFAMYDVVRDGSGAAVALDFVYLVHGKLTTALAACQPGRTVELWGPLGNGFDPVECDRRILVAGGIGYTPFLAAGKESLGAARYGAPARVGGAAAEVVMCYGVRTADLLAGEPAFRAAGLDLRIASDDGSVGHHGLVTDLLNEALDEARDDYAGKRVQVDCCGPEPMMEAVAKICLDRGAPCRVSLETPMACGIGICFSCVAKVKQPAGDWDYKRTCVDGPVFDAAKIEW